MDGDDDRDDFWHLPAWSKNPDQLAAEARSLNMAAYEHAAANAHKHCDPPNGGTDRVY